MMNKRRMFVETLPVAGSVVVDVDDFYDEW